MAGRRIARYEILDEISRGGMGIVYRALDPLLGREIAIKVLPESVASDPSRRARLLQEARAASAIEHPSIAVIHEVGEAEGAIFIAMELVRGEPLSQVLRRGALPPAQTLALAGEIAEGLARAHERGIVHRDLKPGNVIVTDDGHAKVIDFGLAKTGELLSGDDAETTLAAPRTEAGAILGTAAYMAPEQARGLTVDHRADLFAFGVLMFEMVTGRPAFRGRSSLDTLHAVVTDELPPVTGVPGLGSHVATALQLVIAKCTRKAPGERYQGARDLIVDLRAARRLAESGHDPSSAIGAPAVPPQAIAVLPFADMSPGRDQDYLCEGFAEELISALSKLDGLRVVSRSAAFQFRGGAADPRVVGRELNATSLLEGSVRRAGDRLRVTVQLVDVASGFHRWSERFDRDLIDVFAIQDDIAGSVVAALRGVVLDGREMRALARPHTVPRAYELYLRGRQMLPRMAQVDLQQSAGLFEQAIEIDAGYAPAWAGLATVHATLYEWFGAREADLARADTASAKALALAPELAEAHVSRGFVLSLRNRYDEAFDRFDEAMRLDPHLFDAYYYSARAAFARGEIERSATLFGQAADARLEDFQSPMLQGQALRVIGRVSEADIAEREGIRRAERMLALNPHDSRALSLGSGSLLRQGQVDRAIEWADRALALRPDDAGVLVNAACLHAKLRQKEEAIALLERVFANGWGKRDWVLHDPDYDSLRDDPRFQSLLEKLT